MATDDDDDLRTQEDPAAQRPEQKLFQRPWVHSDPSRVTTSLSELADEAQRPTRPWLSAANMRQTPPIPPWCAPVDDHKNDDRGGLHSIGAAHSTDTVNSQLLKKGRPKLSWSRLVEIIPGFREMHCKPG